VTTRDKLELAGRVVAAFVSKNALPRGELAALIQSTHAKLAELERGAQSPPAPQEPAAPVRKSVTPDYLICLDDGKKFKSLKRHLATLGLTPDQYRAKWGLPHDYPMLAPNYAAVRSALAKQTGLGAKRKQVAAPPPAVAVKPKRARAPKSAPVAQ
jgi:predicted transcriptional regulator